MVAYNSKGDAAEEESCLPERKIPVVRTAKNRKSVGNRLLVQKLFIFIYGTLSLPINFIHTRPCT